MPPPLAADKAKTAGTAIYVRKWLRTRNAYIFRLSNKTIQVHFYDHTEIVLSSEARVVTYTDKIGNRSTYPLVDVPSDHGLMERLKYTNETMYHLIVRGGNWVAEPKLQVKPDHVNFQDELTFRRNTLKQFVLQRENLKVKELEEQNEALRVQLSQPWVAPVLSRCLGDGRESTDL